MSFPKPRPAQIILYSYLWNAEHLRGREEGVKDRPCAVVLSTKDDAGSDVVTVLPITHRPPSLSEADFAVEIPHETKRRLGLDDHRSWIMVSEANRFMWPGPDIRMEANDDPASVVYGLLPESLFERVRLKFLDAIKSRNARLVRRSE